MFAARLAQPVSSTVERSSTSAAGLPTAALRRAWTYLWGSVRTHMADLHRLPRPRCGPDPL